MKSMFCYDPWFKIILRDNELMKIILMLHVSLYGALFLFTVYISNKRQNEGSGLS